MPAEVMLQSPRSLHTIEVSDVPILDLRSEEAMAYVGLSPEDVADDDWSACQSGGHAAYFLEMGGVVAPSATGSGLVIGVFEGRSTPGRLSLSGTIALDRATYRAGLDE